MKSALPSLFRMLLGAAALLIAVVAASLTPQFPWLNAAVLMAAIVGGATTWSSVVALRTALLSLRPADLFVLSEKARELDARLTGLGFEWTATDAIQDRYIWVGTPNGGVSREFAMETAAHWISWDAYVHQSVNGPKTACGVAGEYTSDPGEVSCPDCITWGSLHF